MRKSIQACKHVFNNMPEQACKFTYLFSPFFPFRSFSTGQNRRFFRPSWLCLCTVKSRYCNWLISLLSAPKNRTYLSNIQLILEAFKVRKPYFFKIIHYTVVTHCSKNKYYCSYLGNHTRKSTNLNRSEFLMIQAIHCKKLIDQGLQKMCTVKKNRKSLKGNILVLFGFKNKTKSGIWFWLLQAFLCVF
jgi:hypothetical protein